MIVGVEQGTYSVNIGTRQFTVSGLSFEPTKECVLMVLNITQDKIYYAAAQSYTKSLTISQGDSSDSYVFEYSSIFPVLGDDELHIQLQDDTALATADNQATLNALVTALNALVTISNQKILTDDKVHILLQQIRDGIALPPWYVDASNSLNTSGTSTVTLVNSTQTIGTVTTVGGLTNIGGFSAGLITENATFEDWGISVRALLI